MQRQNCGDLPKLRWRIIDARWWIIGALSSLPTLGLGQPKDASPPVLTHSIDASLSYIDLLKRPDTEGGPKLFIELPTNRPRTIGLQHLKLGLQFKHLGSSSLTLGLRPDALSERGGEAAREFDSRAGVTYRRRPRIQLLDTYVLEWQGESSFNAGFGVYDVIVPERSSYPDILSFGLQAELPRKTLAVRIGWRELSVSAPNNILAPVFGPSFELFIFEGQEDRGEQIGRGTHSYDTAPTAQDTNRGVALGANFISQGGYECGGFGGFVDFKEEDGARRSEIFGQVTAGAHFSLIGQYPSQVLIVNRVSRENWRQGLDPRHSLLQVSHSLTLNHEILPKTWVAWGAHYGSSEHYQENDHTKYMQYKGWKGDLGLVKKLDEQLEFSVMATNEYRRRFEDSKINGGFSNEIATRTGLKRMAIGVRYVLAN